MAEFEGRVQDSAWILTALCHLTRLGPVRVLIGKQKKKNANRRDGKKVTVKKEEKDEGCNSN